MDFITVNIKAAEITLSESAQPITLARMIDALQDVVVLGYDGTPFTAYKNNWLRKIMGYFKSKDFDLVSS